MNDTFQWTEQLAFEFAEFVKASGSSPYYQYWGRDLLDKFKQSKMPKKEWEIVSVTEGFGSYIDVDKDGKVRYAHFSDCSVEDALQNRGYKIRSVRRLSDNEVFTVGEYVEAYRWGTQKIDKFEVLKDGDMTVLFETCANPFDKIKKRPKPQQPKKERIEVKDVGIESILIKFEGRRLSVWQIEQVKAAIEKIINYD